MVEVSFQVRRFTAVILPKGDEENVDLILRPKRGPSTSWSLSSSEATEKALGVLE